MNIDQCQYHLTFDIDWAPDFIINEIQNNLDKRHIKATFFITHPSDTIQDLVKSGHNIGLHPNFLPGTSQGNNTLEIIEYLLNLHPDATSLRTHGLVQSSSLMIEIFTNFPQLKYDLSVFLYKFPHIVPSDFPFKDITIKRINYNWEDDIAFHDPLFSWDSILPFAQTMVFDFHPIHIGLNSNSLENYSQLKQELQKKPLYQANQNEISKYRNNTPGTNDFFNQIITSKMKPLDFDALTKL